MDKLEEWIDSVPSSVVIESGTSYKKLIMWSGAEIH